MYDLRRFDARRHLWGEETSGPWVERAGHLRRRTAAGKGAGRPGWHCACAILHFIQGRILLMHLLMIAQEFVVCGDELVGRGRECSEAGTAITRPHCRISMECVLRSIAREVANSVEGVVQLSLAKEVITYRHVHLL